MCGYFLTEYPRAHGLVEAMQIVAAEAPALLNTIRGTEMRQFRWGCVIQ